VSGSGAEREERLPRSDNRIDEPEDHADHKNTPPCPGIDDARHELDGEHNCYRVHDPLDERLSHAHILYSAARHVNDVRAALFIQ